MCISKKTEERLIKLVFRISKLGSGVVTFFIILGSELIYFLIALSGDVVFHPIGYIAAFIVPLVTAYPILWVLLRVTRTIQTQNKDIELKNSLKNTLLSVVAHDVKGPLINIDSILELFFLKEIDENELQELLKELQQQVKTNLDFVQNILQWTKTQFDGFQVLTTPVELDVLVNRIINAFQFQIQQKKLHIETDVTLTANIDRDLMRLVVRNLLSNAIKYSKTRGSIHISAKIENNNLVLKIQDNGIGIDQEKLDNIFDDKVLDSRKGTYSETGTGLGLKLCKTFIDALGGTIKVESEKDRGSIFYVIIPQ